jgi:hypothetical protein
LKSPKEVDQQKIINYEKALIISALEMYGSSFNRQTIDININKQQAYNNN